MPDIILLDANVLDQINRGNQAAANALLSRIRNGDQVYISQQAYNEAAVNALPRQATANRLLLERLNIRPPAIINWANGRMAMSTDIPLITRLTADGSDLTVVDLDPWIPFCTAAAAMVFPANDATDWLFNQAPATHDNLNQLGRYTNIGKMRWVRPENIRVSRRLH